MYDAGGNAVGTRATRWNNESSEPIELPGIQNSFGTATTTDALAINLIGTAAGYSAVPAAGGETSRHAVLWFNDLTFIDLAEHITIPYTHSEAVAISDTGFVVVNGGSSDETLVYSSSITILLPEAGTYGRGDANFDTLINFDDLLILAQNYGTSNTSQDVHVGDFDLNGAVDFDDLLTLAQHYGQNAAVADLSSFDSAFASDWTLARSIVPEPTMLSMLAGVAMLRRRRSTARSHRRTAEASAYASSGC